MTVNQEIAIGAVFILADARFDDRRIAQSRESPAKIIAHERERLAGNAIEAIGINGRTVNVAGDFEAAALDIGNSVRFGGSVEPGGKISRGIAFVACRNAEKINFLARRENTR